MLKNRFDLIPNIIASVKQYMKHEENILTKVTKLRTQMINADNGSKEYFDAWNQISGALKTIFAVAENYPDLKSNTNFLELQRQLERMEDKLQAARRSYNAAVKDFRNRKEQFPSNIVAGFMVLPRYEMYEIDQAETKNPSVAEAFGQ